MADAVEGPDEASGRRLDDAGPSDPSDVKRARVEDKEDLAKDDANENVSGASIFVYKLIIDYFMNLK